MTTSPAAPAQSASLPRQSSPLGLHRVLDPPGVLPQAAWRLDPSPAIAPDEVRVRVDRLNLDAASYRQLRESYAGHPDKIRAAVLDIITTRGKMQNPVTGSGGMLTGTVEEAGPHSPLGLEPGQRIATLVSLTLTPLAINDALKLWAGLSAQIPCEAPALASRVVKEGAVVVIIGAARKSRSPSAAAARKAGASKVIGVVPTEAEAALLRNPAATHLVDGIVIADARDPVGLAEKVRNAGGPADVTVVCVDVAGCEGGAILSPTQGGTVIFFSMATSFSAAALGAEGLAADVTMLVGNGYVPGHAEFALDLLRGTPAVLSLFERRLTS